MRSVMPTALTAEQQPPSGPTGLGQVRVQLVGQLVVLAALVIEPCSTVRRSDRAAARPREDRHDLCPDGDLLRAGREAMDEGHCGLATEELRALAAELLEDVVKNPGQNHN
jgi:hypothetical protein